MHVVLTALLWVVAIGLAIPCAVLFVEVMAAVALGRRTGARAQDPAPAWPRFAVLVPAHNEEAAIADTVANLRGSLPAPDALPPNAPSPRLIVIADNCTDRTAEYAARAGAEVLERRSETEKGKAYALAHAVRALAADPPDVVVFVDADCHLEPGALQAIVTRAATTGRPTQALYLLTLPPKPGVRDRVSAFAFLFKNQVRATGMAALSLPCHLTGTGMAFPWGALQSVPLASASLVEDLEYGLKLALAGMPPQLCADATVLSQLPQQSSAAVSQRRRWEHGFLATMGQLAPRVIFQGLARRNVGLVALGADLLVPPLSLLVALLAGVTMIGAALAIGGFADWRPAAILLGALGATALAVMSGWARFGRSLITLGTLLGAPLYVLWKLPIYVTFIFRRQKRWVRTARDEEKPPAPTRE